MAHRPIDYSKWDNIDTDSDADDDGPPPPPPPQQPQPVGGASRPQQSEFPQLLMDQIPAGAPLLVTSRDSAPPGKPWNAPQPGLYFGGPREDDPLPPGAPEPPPRPRDGEILCTYGPCRGERSEMFFRPTSLPADHPAFRQAAPSPVAARVGLPLVVYRLDPRPSLFIPRTAAYDNQRVTYMMISPNSGFAGPEWQQGIGSVILARSDRKPLPAQHVEAFWMFCERLLDYFSSGENPEPDEEMIPATWQAFFRQYKADYSEMPSRRDEWKDIWLPWEEAP